MTLLSHLRLVSVNLVVYWDHIPRSLVQSILSMLYLLCKTNSYDFDLLCGYINILGTRRVFLTQHPV